MPEDRLTVGVDLGGTTFRVGVYDNELTMLAEASRPTRVADGPVSVVEEMAAVISSLAEGKGRVQGIGIGSPGPINLQTGALGILPNFPGWNGFLLRDALGQASGCDVVLESDANAAALAEWKCGAAKQHHVQSLAMLTLGTGVGSGIVLAGKVWHGMFGMSGEVGHTSVDPDGLLCSCGTRGCLEMYASAKGLMRLAKQVGDSPSGSAALRRLLSSDGSTAGQLALLAEQDEAARVAFRSFGRYLGMGIAGIVNCLDLPMIVVGGGVAAAWPLFAPAMFDAVEEFSIVYRLVKPTQREAFEKDRTFICPAQLGSKAGLLGAALLPRLEQTQQAVLKS